jgi:hypothetical protein
MTARVCDDYAESILAGQFVEANLRFWASHRLLVRAVDAVYRHVLDMEDVADLGGKVAAEHAAAVSIDLDDAELPDDAEAAAE